MFNYNYQNYYQRALLPLMRNKVQGGKRQFRIDEVLTHTWNF